MGTKVAFVAGATGFTGRAMAAQDPARHDVELRLQVRPGSRGGHKLEQDRRVVSVDLADRIALEDALLGVDCVVQLIGTVRARFAETGDYEAVDYGTTLRLLDAAKLRQVPHFLLVSSVGAGHPIGEYLRWKKRTEDAVRQSGLPYTIVRPSYLAGDEMFPERAQLSATSAFLRGFSESMFGGGLAADLRPINIQVLARVLLSLVRDGATRRVLVGRHLWHIAREQRLYDFVDGNSAELARRA
ncbi:MAG: NAD(P)H-binding protein [Myxococcota bacterium]